MNYQKIYDQLVSHRQENPATGYTERHHILPKSLGGSDDPSNLVVLTGREHWVAHMLLHKIHRCLSTACACHRMTFCKRGFIKNSRMFQYVREEHAKYASILGKQRVGKKNGSFGTMWICNVDLQENKKISKDDEIPDGWVKGRNKWALIPLPRLCEKCGGVFYAIKKAKRRFCCSECASHKVSTATKLKLSKQALESGRNSGKNNGKHKAMLKRLASHQRASNSLS